MEVGFLDLRYPTLVKLVQIKCDEGCRTKLTASSIKVFNLFPLNLPRNLRRKAMKTPIFNEKAHFLQVKSE